MATLSKGEQAALRAAGDVVARGEAIGDAEVVKAGEAAMNKITGGKAPEGYVVYSSAQNQASGGAGAGGTTGNQSGVPEGNATYSAAAKNAGGQGAAGGGLAKELKGLYSGGSAYDAAMVSMMQANQAATDQAVAELKGQKAEVNQSYGDMFRQLYKQKMQARKNIGQQMAAQGVTGGASESTMLGLETGYSEALRQGEQERIQSQNELDRAISEAKMTGKLQNAQMVMDGVRDRTNSYAGVLQGLLNRQDSWDMHNENMEYQKGRDQVADNWQQKTWDYNVEQAGKSEERTAQQDARARIQNFLAMGGGVDAVYATFDEATLTAAGLTRGEMEQMAAYQAEQKALQATQRVTTTGGGGGGNPSPPSGNIYQRMYEAGVTGAAEIAAYLIDEGYSDKEVTTLTGHYTNWLKSAHWDGTLSGAYKGMTDGSFGSEFARAWSQVQGMYVNGASDEEIVKWIDDNYKDQNKLSDAGVEYIIYQLIGARQEGV